MDGYSVASRFSQSVSLNPLQKLEQSVDWLLAGRLDAPSYLASLDEIGHYLALTQQKLERIHFPEHYDAGPTLLEFSRQALNTLAEVVEQLAGLVERPDGQQAEACLRQARQAFQSLSDVQFEVQTERGGT